MVVSVWFEVMVKDDGAEYDSNARDHGRRVGLDIIDELTGGISTTWLLDSRTAASEVVKEISNVALGPRFSKYTNSTPVLGLERHCV